MFVGRKDEINYLNKKYESNKSEFIIIYGARRIGKTELIKQFVKDKNYVFYSANQVDNYEQLSRFSMAINHGNILSSISMSYGSWDDTFKALALRAKAQKLVVVIDEFPYMVNSNKSIPSILQNIWDHYLKETQIMLILSGSSVSFMMDNILGANNPLYGRITGSYKLGELPFNNLKEFYPNYSQEELICVYGILGGVPQYLLTFNSKKTIQENIIEAILSKGSALYDEVNLLMKQELREPAIYFTLIEAIAMGNTKLNDIHQKTQIEKTKINAYLKRLITLDIIRREFPVTEKQKKKSNVQRGLYQINTNFFKFYFKYVFANNSMLELGAASKIYHNLIALSLSEYTSLIYEELCRQSLINYNIKGSLPFFMKEIGRWWYKQNEIDVVGYDEKENYIFGECKWRNEVTNEKVYYDLVEKSTKYFKFKTATYYLFSKSRFSDDLVKLEKKQNNLKLVNLFSS